MILNYLLGTLVHILNWIIGLMPGVDLEPVGLTATFKLMAKPLSIFPIDMFHYILLNGLTWLVILNAWSIVEWLYKKIPGVD